MTTALSRVAMGRHYFFDVCAGLLLGVGTMGILSSVRGGGGEGARGVVQPGGMGLVGVGGKRRPHGSHPRLMGRRECSLRRHACRAASIGARC